MPQQCSRPVTRVIIILLGRDNLFSRPIPHNIGQVMPNLTYLDISKNSLSGSIPLSFGNLSQLEFMFISNNHLSGEVPHFWNNIPLLFIVDMSDNNLSGTIPGSLGSLTLLMFLILSSNNFSGKVPSFKNCTYLNILDLGDNKEMPVGITSLIKLGTLNLSMNHLIGNIQVNIGNLRSIETLDLSMNKLSGSIPQSMVSLTFLNHLNLSYNNLSGKIPTGNQFQTFVDPSIYEGNAGLSCCPLPTGCQDKEEAPQFVISVVIGFCAGFWGVFGTLAMKRSWRHAYFHFLDKVKDVVLDFVSAICTYLRKRS
ncbi:hypothetical protein PRUPE_7G033600 [Prunus persica]|uniref:Leucine-rich repeat-containing N-terminal plant-type domain-containing protein n=1 Tax=Prunus persica TaxID=3760 RepID=M5VU96_PRUPE|nr:hypothetical protein PRUPE_7G033600 [Prunus persica]